MSEQVWTLRDGLVDDRVNGGSLVGPHLAPAAEPVAPPPLTLTAFGMHLHAATTVDGRDRQQLEQQLERLCRYLLRPPFAHNAVQALEGGRIRVYFNAP